MTFIIAEAGVNHNGNPNLGFDLIDAAKSAGADAVKFQMFDAEKLEPPGSRRDMLARLQLEPATFIAFGNYANDAGIEFMATPFDVESLKFLVDLGVTRIKISSADLLNEPLIRAANETKCTLIVSTGMATQEDMRRAWVLANADVIMHCVSCYPCPVDQLNLQALNNLDPWKAASFGLSDHTRSTVIAAAAVAMGATYIEKHLTLDRNMEGPDHKASLEPHEFAEMVRNIREVEAAMGDGIKRLMPCEAETIKIREEREQWRRGYSGQAAMRER